MPEEFLSERISVVKAAEMLGIPEYTIREWVKRGTLKIGGYIKGKGKKRATIYIYKNLVMEEIQRRKENPSMWFSRCMGEEIKEE